MKQLVLFLGIIFLAACQPEEDREVKEIIFSKEAITVLRQDEPELSMTVEIADTDEKRIRGLMYRTGLTQDDGMLFLFPSSGKVSMWMANTPESLDMLFIDEGGRITEIVENTVPFSREQIRSDRRVKAVLELKGGASKHKGIKTGDYIVYSFFGLKKEE